MAPTGFQPTLARAGKFKKRRFLWAFRHFCVFGGCGEVGVYDKKIKLILNNYFVIPANASSRQVKCILRVRNNFNA